MRPITSILHAISLVKLCPKFYSAMAKQTVKEDILNMPELKLLSDLFSQRGYLLRLAGGAVRDILLNIQPNDYDLASDATPDKMIEILSNKENIRLITTPSGERHGTVAALINGSKMFEITTLRIDKITDGRHAEVEFIQDWKLDALRRDFTINSIFMELDGSIIDYFNGQKDLSDGVIRFVGNPVERIKEDYLRIMRYFRFYSRFGHQDHEKETVKALADNIDGLSSISGERIWSEMKKTLVQRNCDKVIPLLFDINVASYMGFYTETKPMDLEEFFKVHKNVWSMSTSFEPITLFSSLIRSPEEQISLISRLKMSNFEKETSFHIITNRNDEYNLSLHNLKKQLVLTSKSNQKVYHRYTLELLKYKGLQDIYNDLADWNIPTFPLRGDKIGPKMKRRQLISQVMSELKSIWADNQFEMTEQELINEMDRLIEKYNSIN
ncbi:CCA tRNA nucleotidyltransferase 1, mitochondrial [Tetranychus urticae]|uniref:Poly A polymerase head domain-containing protein n=1 Tax=Tetranychus urticae TaxID=32264 RepID=T1K4T0_TETUR|nr:CCA tRNA nucleotidyltransferase 1, mitochondrial [Tetranychus urticae]